ncbi:MAG: FAD-binding protein [Alphaproteobacteria bacterium]|nr:MAG: FAD-binding protein [Alphaproteobacteria bacterium]
MKLSRRTFLAGTGVAVAAAGGAAYVASRRFDIDDAAFEARLKAHKWRNWSGIETCDPAVIAAPADEAELAMMLKTAKGPVRAVGAGHSFTALVPTDSTLLSLDRLSGIRSHDAEALTARVGGGSRLFALAPALDRIGQAMVSLPDINKQSLAGAMATATHATGIGFGALPTFIKSLRLVTASGDVLDCSRDKDADLFKAAAVSLGALGIISEIELQNRTSFNLKRHTWTAPVDDILDGAHDTAAAHRSFEFYYIPHSGYALGITTDETDEPVTPIPPDQDDDGLETLRTARNWLSYIGPVRRSALKSAMQDVPEETLVASSWQLLSKERPIRFNETEFHLPREALAPCLREIIALVEKDFPEVFFPMEIRFVKEDDLWLSPFHGRPSASIAVHGDNREDHRKLFAAVQAIFMKHDGRPHWGKLHPLKDAELAPKYDRWQDFKTIRQQLDPHGLFMNAYLKGLFGLEAMA